MTGYLLYPNLHQLAEDLVVTLSLVNHLRLICPLLHLPHHGKLFNDLRIIKYPHPASYTDRAIHAFPNKTRRPPGPEILYYSTKGICVHVAVCSAGVSIIITLLAVCTEGLWD